MGVKLKVAEAYTRDVGRGVIRIDYDAMDTLGSHTGDYAQIIGKSTTVAKVLPLYPSDEGRGTVRMDGLIRNNAAVVIGDAVELTTAKLVPATRVVLEEMQESPPINFDSLAHALDSQAVMISDEVMMPYFGGRLTFKVVDFEPKAEGVIIDKETKLELKPKEQPPEPKMRYFRQYRFAYSEGFLNDFLKNRQNEGWGVNTFFVSPKTGKICAVLSKQYEVQEPTKAKTS